MQSDDDQNQGLPDEPMPPSPEPSQGLEPIRERLNESPEPSQDLPAEQPPWIGVLCRRGDPVQPPPNPSQEPPAHPKRPPPDFDALYGPQDYYPARSPCIRERVVW